jgi:hypothetical protein
VAKLTSAITTLLFPYTIADSISSQSQFSAQPIPTFSKGFKIKKIKKKSPPGATVQSYNRFRNVGGAAAQMIDSLLPTYRTNSSSQATWGA